MQDERGSPILVVVARRTVSLARNVPDASPQRYQWQVDHCSCPVQDHRREAVDSADTTGRQFDEEVPEARCSSLGFTHLVRS